MPTTIVQISDLHIGPAGSLAHGRVDTAAALAETVAAIGRLPQAPDAVLASGDLVDAGDADSYARLRTLLAPLAMPVWLMPGNHDGRDALRRAFPDHDELHDAVDGGFIQYRRRIGGLTLIALDSVVPGRDHGVLDDARLDWLEHALADSVGEPVMIALHHPPFASLVDCMDRIGLRHGGERLSAIVRRHPNVEQLVCGHLHRAITARFAGTVVTCAPAPAYRFHLDFAAGSRYAYTLEAPQLRIHAWTAETGVVSHLVDVRPFDGPHPLGA